MKTEKEKKTGADMYRGLLGDSLAGEGADDGMEDAAPVLTKAQESTRDIDLKRISPDLEQARKVFEDIEEMAESIKQNGILDPLIVRRSGPTSFVLVAGERRFRGAALAGLKSVPCFVREFKDADEISLIHNVHRKDLKYVEVCIKVHDLLEKKKYKQRDLATKLVRTESYISEAVKTALFAKKYQAKYGSLDEIYTARSSDGRLLGKSHFVEIVNQPSFEAQVALFKKIISGSLTVREIRKVKDRKRIPPIWNNTEVIKQLKSLRRKSSIEILNKFDPATRNEKMVSELEETYAHFSSFLGSLKQVIDLAKGSRG